MGKEGRMGGKGRGEKEEKFRPTTVFKCRLMVVGGCVREGGGGKVR